MPFSRERFDTLAQELVQVDREMIQVLDEMRATDRSSVSDGEQMSLGKFAVNWVFSAKFRSDLRQRVADRRANPTPEDQARNALRAKLAAMQNRRREIASQLRAR